MRTRTHPHDHVSVVVTNSQPTAAITVDNEGVHRESSDGLAAHHTTTRRGSRNVAEIKRRWVDDLTPAHPEDLAEPASNSTYERISALLSPGAVQWAVETAQGMARHIVDEMSDFGTGDGAFQTVRTGTESHLLTITAMLALDDPSLCQVTPETVIADRDFVRRNIALNKVLRGVQLGHAFALRRFLEACEQKVPPRERANEMRQITELMLEFFDVFSDKVACEYLAERDRWVSTAAAARKELVRALLAEETTDVAAAEPALGYNLSRTHIAFILESDRPASADPGELQRTAVHLLDHIKCQGSLIVPEGANTVWAWGAVTTTSVLDNLHSFDMPEQIRVATGVPQPRLAGFIRSHRQARHAIRLARERQRTPDASWLTDYATNEIACLMSLDLPMARDFVHRTLGELAGPGAGLRDSRETLLAYLDAERSVNAVAKQLHVARNTVSYRVKRAEALLGRSIADRQLELHVALLLEKAIGSARES